ncbi:hypothetical protein VSK91_07225 [Bacillus swezeyi]
MTFIIIQANPFAAGFNDSPGIHFLKGILEVLTSGEKIGFMPPF